MRCISLLATSFGILLHAVLGWCPQHACCGSATHDSSPTNGHYQQHHSCQGHQHATSPQNHDSSTDQDSVPTDDTPHGCDHADCLFVSYVVSVQQFAAPSLCLYEPLVTVDEISALQLTELRENSLRLFLPYSQGQSARIARGVWLI